MYELLYFNDFPKCKNHKILVKDSNKNNLIDECKNRLKQAEYCNPQTMLCIMDNGQVIHPVISNLKGGTTHPCQDGWIWLTGKGYTVEEREKNHQEFTKKLNSHMRGIVTPPMIDIEKSSTQNSPVKQDISGKNKEKKTNIKKTNQKRNNKETEKKEIFYQKWDGITDRNVLSNYFEKVKELYNSANYQLNKKVVGNMPILWFGDHEKYIKSHVKIVTVGYNPSDKEFSKQRFGNLANKTINEISLEEYINALNSYFYNTPYREWFGQFKWYLQQFGASFENGVMHIDLYSAIATSPTWKGLSDEEKEIVSQRDICNGLLFDFLKPDVILCNFDIRELNIEYEKFIEYQTARKRLMAGCCAGKIYIGNTAGHSPFAFVSRTDRQNFFRQIFSEFNISSII